MNFGSSKFGIYRVLRLVQPGLGMQLVLPQVPVRQVLVYEASSIITSCPYQCWVVISFSNNHLSRCFFGISKLNNQPTLVLTRQALVRGWCCHSKLLGSLIPKGRVSSIYITVVQSSTRHNTSVDESIESKLF